MKYWLYAEARPLPGTDTMGALLPPTGYCTRHEMELHREHNINRINNEHETATLSFNHIAHPSDHDVTVHNEPANDTVDEPCVAPKPCPDSVTSWL